jgi:hypothetical protein
MMAEPMIFDGRAGEMATVRDVAVVDGDERALRRLGEQTWEQRPDKTLRTVWRA